MKCRHTLCFLVLTVLIALFVCAASAEYRTLKKGDTGDDVLALKERMYRLGYFTNPKLTDSYNGTTVERVMLLQKINGFEQDGIASPELQEWIFSDNCIWQAPTPEPTAVPTPVPTPVGPSVKVEMPDMDQEGFTRDGTEFIHSDREDGHWLLLNSNTAIEIRRYTDPFERIVWFETYIRMRGSQRFVSLLSDGKIPGRAFMHPDKLAAEKNAVFAITDDFFGYRHTNLKTDILGILIRNGKIIGTKTKKESSKNWPPLDILALFSDGRMKTFISDSHTAEEYLDMGVTDTWAFGPVLVADGEIPSDLNEWNQKSKEPRMALGYMGERRYCVLTVVGRRKESSGATLKWMAEKIRDMGAVEALNLDGGGTAALIFDGDVLNRQQDWKSSDLRSVTSLIGILTASETDQ